MATTTLSKEMLAKLDAYWRAGNYLSVGQIYLYDNPLLKQPLKLEHIKPMLLGHTLRSFHFYFKQTEYRPRDHQLFVGRYNAYSYRSPRN